MVTIQHPFAPRQELVCFMLWNLPFVYPPGHPKAGEIAQFVLKVPGTYRLRVRAPAPLSKWYADYRVDIDKYSRTRFRFLKECYPETKDDIEEKMRLVSLMEVPPGCGSAELIDGRDRELLTTKEAAAYLKVKVRRMYDYVRAGILRGYKVGQRWRFRRRDLDAFLERNATAG